MLAHQRLRCLQGSIVVRSPARSVGYDHLQQLVGGSGEVIGDARLHDMVEEDDTVCVPPRRLSTRGIHGSLPRHPETVQSGVDSAKTIVAVASYEVSPWRISQRQAVSIRH